MNVAIYCCHTHCTIAAAAVVALGWRSLLQLTDQVQRINGKLQASIATLGQTSSADGSTAAGSSNAASAGDAAPGAVASSSGTRAKIETMSAEVVDSNPYSTLMRCSAWAL